MTESDIFALLRERYPRDSHVLLPHVRDRTGSHGKRTADAIAMGLWPSRGLEMEGFEIKVSRSDWLREKKDPSKAESICRFCDRWWLVVSDDSIVKDGELPPTWGLLVASGGKLKPKTLAPKLSPADLDRAFLAAFLRQMQEEVVPKAEIQKRVDDSFRFGQEHGEREMKAFKKSWEDLLSSVKQFEEASGVTITAYNGKKIGAAVNAVMKHGEDAALTKMKYARSILSTALENLEAIVEEAEEEMSKSRDSSLS